MKILLYNPDNGVTHNFMPHLWMFLLKSLTPAEHEVLLIDGNAKPMDEQQLVQFVKDEQIGLVGIGAMTRMIARAYRMADAIRAVGVPVVMGGPHVTEVPDEALGKDGGKRHADAVALGEADETWPLIVEDAAKGKDVRIGGGVATIRQYLTAGLIDEIHLALSPVFLGEGEHLFIGLNLHALGFTSIKTVASEKATHVLIKKR